MYPDPQMLEALNALSGRASIGLDNMGTFFSWLQTCDCAYSTPAARDRGVPTRTCDACCAFVYASGYPVALEYLASLGSADRVKQLHRYHTRHVRVLATATTRRRITLDEIMNRIMY
jgi:hypothetical protein